MSGTIRVIRSPHRPRSHHSHYSQSSYTTTSSSTSTDDTSTTVASSAQTCDDLSRAPSTVPSLKSNGAPKRKKPRSQDLLRKRSLRDTHTRSNGIEKKFTLDMIADRDERGELRSQRRKWKDEEEDEENEESKENYSDTHYVYDDDQTHDGSSSNALIHTIGTSERNSIINSSRSQLPEEDEEDRLSLLTFRTNYTDTSDLTVCSHAISQVSGMDADAHRYGMRRRDTGDIIVRNTGEDRKDMRRRTRLVEQSLDPFTNHLRSSATHLITALKNTVDINQSLLETFEKMLEGWVEECVEVRGRRREWELMKNDSHQKNDEQRQQAERRRLEHQLQQHTLDTSNLHDAFYVLLTKFDESDSKRVELDQIWMRVKTEGENAMNTVGEHEELATITAPAIDDDLAFFTLGRARDAVSEYGGGDTARSRARAQARYNGETDLFDMQYVKARRDLLGSGKRSHNHEQHHRQQHHDDTLSIFGDGTRSVTGEIDSHHITGTTTTYLHGPYAHATTTSSSASLDPASIQRVVTQRKAARVLKEDPYSDDEKGREKEDEVTEEQIVREEHLKLHHYAPDDDTFSQHSTSAHSFTLGLDPSQLTRETDFIKQQAREGDEPVSEVGELEEEWEREERRREKGRRNHGSGREESDSESESDSEDDDDSQYDTAQHRHRGKSSSSRYKLPPPPSALIFSSPLIAANASSSSNTNFNEDSWYIQFQRKALEKEERLALEKQEEYEKVRDRTEMRMRERNVQEKEAARQQQQLHQQQQQQQPKYPSHQSQQQQQQQSHGLNTTHPSTQQQSAAPSSTLPLTNTAILRDHHASRASHPTSQIVTFQQPHQNIYHDHPVTSSSSSVSSFDSRLRTQMRQASEWNVRHGLRSASSMKSHNRSHTKAATTYNPLAMVYPESEGAMMQQPRGARVRSGSHSIKSSVRSTAPVATSLAYLQQLRRRDIQQAR